VTAELNPQFRKGQFGTRRMSLYITRCHLISPKEEEERCHLISPKEEEERCHLIISRPYKGADIQLNHIHKSM
jgi:hypothetical protein